MGGFDTSTVAFGLPILLKGFVNTALFCGGGIVFGLILAIPVALARISDRAGLRWPALGFIEVIRNTPFLVQAFIVFFVLPAFGLRLDPSTSGILVLTAHATAYFSESIRGAMESVPKGQMEAAESLGLSYLVAIRLIIFPQMLGYLIPSLTNQMIGVIKESAALSIIAVPELSMAGQVVLGIKFSPIETYAMVGILYWAFTAAIAAVMMRLELRFVDPMGRALPRAEPTTKALSVAVGGDHK